MSILSNRLSRSITFASLVLSAVSLSMTGQAAQDTSLTLHQALDEAGASPQVERAHSAAEEASWRRVESLNVFMPTVTAGASRLFSKKYALLDVNLGGGTVTFPQVIPTTTYSVGFILPLFDGLGAFDRFDAAKAGENAGRKEFEWTKFQTQREVILQFYRALAAQILHDVAAQNVKTLEDHLNDTRLFKKSGVSTNYDVLRVEVQASEARSDLLNSTDEITVSQQRLAQVLGRDAETRTLQGALPELDPKLINGLDIQHTGERADIAALRDRASAADYTGKSDAKWWVPKVFVEGEYQSYNNRGDEYWDDNAFREAYTLGLEVRWTLFDGFSSYARTRESNEKKYQADRTLRIAEIKAKTDFDFWRRKFLYYCTVYRSRLEDVSRSTESVRLAREGRRVGVRTNTELLDAETDLYRAKAGSVNAQLGAVEALINLELASGQELYHF